MRTWIAASVVFFVYIIAVTPLVRGLPSRKRVLAAAGAVAGLLLSAAAWRLSYRPILHDWLMPPVLLLLGYWTSGLLFAAPMPAIERALESIDLALDIDRLAARAPRWLAELLELSYAGVYVIIPIALLIHLFRTPAPDAARFWTVLLVTDFICFGFLPWIQTRPPRAFRTRDPWISRIRRFNILMLGKTSIQANTFPSGHAAEGLAAALLVTGAPPLVVLAIGAGAVLISAGAVLGRYHFGADAIAGWIVAIAVWWLV